MSTLKIPPHRLRRTENIRAMVRELLRCIMGVA